MKNTPASAKSILGGKKAAEEGGPSRKGETGTAATGFDSDGPYSCMNCVHRTPHSLDEDGELVDSCRHPKVMGDPELADKRLPDGTVKVDHDDCCRFVRPEEG